MNRRAAEQLDLLDYPHAPGFRDRDTSRDAAPAVLEASRLRDRVLAAIRRAGEAGLTADEAAVNLGLTAFTCRPRCTELAKLGLVRDCGERRTNLSGRKAIAWVAVAPECLVGSRAEAERRSRRQRTMNEAERQVRRIVREEG